MWNMKCFVIPVITGATGIVTRGLKKYLEGKESATIRNLTPEWWGSPLVQEEKYQNIPVIRE
jgi:hypothetical protein